MDVEILARIQFALTISFHYIFPPLSIGVGVMLVLLEGMYLRTGDKAYEILTRFWIRIFALIFGLGVATGIVMEFQFGTNWAAYSRYVGDIFGSALAAEGIFSFALESIFLGILIFGWNRVGPKVHFFSTIMVALGSIFSAIWIVVANSWMQTPAGFHIVTRGTTSRAEVTDFWAMVFNPSSVDRILHVVVGAFLAGAFLVLSVHAYYIYKNRHVQLSRKAFKIALIFASVSAIMQLLLGSISAEGVSRNQPAKMAAFEGHYDSLAPADLYLLGWVNQEKQQVTGIKIPNGLSFLLHQDFVTPVKGLNAFPADYRPQQVNFVFQTYHFMLAIGLFLIALTFYALFLWWRGKLFSRKWLMLLFTFSIFFPQLANQLGWYSAEVGRQPWVVYGLLRTSDALSKSVKADQVLISLIMFTLIYLLLFALFIYLLDRKIKHGFEEAGNENNPNESRLDKPLI